jgi:HAD superfamily hydrolase (TIGR01509 family)
VSGANGRAPVAVVFDNDGLLLDTEVAWTSAEQALFRTHGSVFTDEHKRDIIGSSAAVAAVKLERMLAMPGEGVVLMTELHELVMATLLDGVEPMPGAVALLDALSADGRRLALASNSRRDFIARALEVSGLAGRFDVVLSAQDVEHPKPAPDIYLAACAAFDAEPARCAGLEDTQTGVSALRAAGLYAIAVPSLAGIELDGADLVAPSLADDTIYAALGLER